MVAPHPIKEFNNEVEPKLRRCLFCERTPPPSLGANDMIWKYRRSRGWYSNALLNMKTRQIARFYVCKEHFNLIHEAWEWAEEGFN